MEAITRPAPNAMTRPATVPAATGAASSLATSQRTEVRLEPNALRNPISRVVRDTENAITL
jgi:hypothetical protein